MEEEKRERNQLTEEVAGAALSDGKWREVLRGLEGIWGSANFSQV